MNIVQVSTAVLVVGWWLLCIAAVAIGAVCTIQLNRSGRRGKGWIIFIVTVVVVFLTAIRNTVYLAYVTEYKHQHETAPTWYTYVVFAHLSYSTFLGLLLLVAAGYRITRLDLGEHTSRVFGIPPVVFVTGLLSDLMYYTVLKETKDETTSDDLSNTTAALVWFICTMVNLATLILAWVYIFDLLQQETEKLLKAEQQMNMKRTEATARDEQPLPDVVAISNSQRADLLPPGQNSSHLAEQPRFSDDGDVEAMASVFEKIHNDAKLTMLTRFGWAVSAYLVATVCAMFIPVFVPINVAAIVLLVQNLVHYIFIGSLVIIFRPRSDSPYLMIGASDNDAEDRGIDQLTTELAMVEDAPAVAGDVRRRDQVGGVDAAVAYSTKAAPSPLPRAPQRLPAAPLTAVPVLPPPNSAARTASPADSIKEEHIKNFSLDGEEEEVLEQMDEIHLSRSPANQPHNRGPSPRTE